MFLWPHQYCTFSPRKTSWSSVSEELRLSYYLLSVSCGITISRNIKEKAFGTSQPVFTKDMSCLTNLISSLMSGVLTRGEKCVLFPSPSAGFPTFGEMWTWSVDKKVDGNCLDTLEFVSSGTNWWLITAVSSQRWILMPILCETSIINLNDGLEMHSQKIHGVNSW